MKTALKVTGSLLGLGVVLISGVLIYVSAFLPNVGPAPEMSIEVTADRVERGKHLANDVMACMHCHTPHNKKQFVNPVDSTMMGAGGVLFGKEEEGLPGNYYSRNITPAALGDWSDGEIFRAITQGVSKDGSALFPIMPWPNYAQLDEEDIKDIIAYLRTLEPVEHEVPASKSDFPMNFIINTMPAAPDFSTKPDISDRVAYGKYLVTSASCSDCHTPWDKGEPTPGMAFAGGNEFKLVTGGTVRTANITPHMQTGIGSWTEEAFLKRFRAHNDPEFQHFDIAEGSFNTVMPWMNYSKMSDEELKSIFAYLQSLDPVENLVVRFTPEE
ncbi:cytochrome c [Balneola sp. MJW-20]|uniref:c-type cytochrome n=1 Tax=Gracilimonas aurantiaca TaxID=3234185 RepID=UPI0034655C06